MTEAHTLKSDDIDGERTWYTVSISEVTIAREKVISAKNHFWRLVVLINSGTVWQGRLHHDVQQRAHFTMVSISRYVKIVDYIYSHSDVTRTSHR